MATKIPAGVSVSVVRYQYRRAMDKRAWQSIERALVIEGSSFGDRCRVHRAIRKAVNQQIGRRLVWDGSPGEADVRKRIEKVRGAAEALDRKLGALTDTEVGLLRTADIRSGRNNWFSYASGFRGPVLDLVRLTGSVLASLPASRGGPPEDLPKRALVEHLDEIYREAGKIPKAGGETDSEFVTLVSAVLILADEEGVDGLSKAVQRALSAQQKRDTTHRTS